MADLKKQAKRARKRLEDLDFEVDVDRLRKRMPDVDVDQLRKRLPDHLDWNIIRQREDEAASRGFMGGFVLGVIVGALLALVFAPRRGEETRELVKDKATELVHQVRGEVDEHRNDLNDQGPAIEREFGDSADALLESARRESETARSQN